MSTVLTILFLSLTVLVIELVILVGIVLFAVSILISYFVYLGTKRKFNNKVKFN